MINQTTTKISNHTPFFSSTEFVSQKLE